MAVAGGYTNGMGGPRGFGQSMVEWSTVSLGPLDQGGSQGFPTRRRHTLGRIPAPPAAAASPASDAAAWAALREIPGLLTTSDRNVRAVPAMTRAQATAEQTIAGLALSVERAGQLERDGVPERWRGPMPAFAKLADDVHLWLTEGVPSASGAATAGMVTSELALYLQAVQLGQIQHPAVQSAAFRDTLRNTYELAWLVHHLRQGHGEAWRMPVATGNPNDVAWRYTDESSDRLLLGLAPGFFQPGWVPGWTVQWAPGDATTQDVAILQDAIARGVLELRAELRGAMIPSPAAPVPGMSPPTPSASRRTIGLTAVLVAVAAAALSQKWIAWPRLGRLGRRRRGGNGGNGASAPRLETRSDSARSAPTLQLL